MYYKKKLNYLLPEYYVYIYTIIIQTYKIPQSNQFDRNV